MKRRLIGVAAAVLGTVLVSGPGLQMAAAADPLPTTVTLPLFGAPLTIGITTGPGGALTTVSVDPADNTVATKLKPHKVVFESSNPANPTGDPAKVVVKSRKGGQSVSARAGSLAEVSGPGIWKGDVFGDGTLTTVNFTIVAAADGSPDITGITTSGAAGVVGEVKHSPDDDDDEMEASAKVSIKFTNADGDQSRTLSIKVKLEDDDGKSEAKLSLAVSGIKGVAVAAADAAGPHTWTGLLCDGSAASIAYTVAVDGIVSAVTATPATAEVRTDDSKIDVRFSHDERVRIRVRADDGLIRIDVKQRIRCDSADPTTNASTTSTIADDDEGDDDGDHRGGGGDGRGDNKGGGDHGDDDSSTSSSSVPGA